MVLCGDGTRQRIMPAKTFKEASEVLLRRSRDENRGHKTPCRIWVGCKDSCGYGVMRFLGKNRKITRLWWQANHGSIPEKHEICHRCDQTDCIRDDHLFTDTHLGNMTDAKMKNRMVTTFGEKHYCASFTENQIRELRIKFKNGLRVTRKLASQYMVSPNALSKIMRFESWKHVK